MRRSAADAIDFGVPPERARLERRLGEREDVALALARIGDAIAIASDPMHVGGRDVASWWNARSPRSTRVDISKTALELFVTTRDLATIASKASSHGRTVDRACLENLGGEGVRCKVTLAYAEVLWPSQPSVTAFGSEEADCEDGASG